MHSSQRKTSLSLIAALLLILPLAHCFTTYQVFGINKLLAFVVLNGLLLITTSMGRGNHSSASWRSPITILLLALLLELLLATWFGASPLQSLFGSPERRTGLLFWINVAALIIAIRSLELSPSEIRTFVIVPLLLSASLQAVIAITQIMAPGMLLPALSAARLEGRAFGTLGNPNFLAQFIVPSLITAIGMFRNDRHWKWLIMALLIGSGLIFTQSRGGILAALVGIALVFLWPHDGRSLRRHGIQIIVTLVLLAGALPVLCSATRCLERTASLQSRWWLLQSGLAAIQEEPLVGYGPETTAAAIEKHLSKEFLHLEATGTIPDRVHNLVIDTTLQIGLLGILLILVLGYFLVRSIIKQSDAHPLHRTISVAVVALLVCWQFSFPMITDAAVFGILLSVLLPHLKGHHSSPLMGTLRTGSCVIFGVVSIFAALHLWNADRLLKEGIVRNDPSILEEAKVMTPWDRRIDDVLEKMRGE